MKIGLIADKHNQIDRTKRAVDQLIEAVASSIMHAGDFTIPEIIVECAKLPLFFVFGNNDSDAVPELKAAGQEYGAVCLEWGAEVLFKKKRIAMTHGHLHTESRPLLAAEPDYFIVGHSHVAIDRREGSTRWLNPGALHRATEYSVAVLDIATDEVQFLDVAR